MIVNHLYLPNFLIEVILLYNILMLDQHRNWSFNFQIRFIRQLTSRIILLIR